MKKFFNMNDKPYVFDSEKKTGWTDDAGKFDQLNLLHYADVLATFIEDCETPMTIGLQGDWGIGKSTLLNMLKSELEQKKGVNYPIVEFNTWQYSLFGEDEYLGLSAINAMLSLLKNKFKLKEEEGTTLSKASTKITAALKTMKFGFGPISIDPNDYDENNNDPLNNIPYVDISDQMKELKNYFDEIIASIMDMKYDEKNTENPYAKDNKGQNIGKIVFFIDDIDRVRPVKALELLESLKNFFDAEHCVFVLAVDYEVVQTGMAEKLGVDLQKTSGKSFFDKIINLPFNMPTQSYSLSNYLKELFQQAENTSTEIQGSLTPKSLLRESEKNFKDLEDIVSCTIGRNPRSIKRAVNYMKIIGLLRANVRETLEANEGEKLGLNALKKKYLDGEFNEALDVKLRWALVCMQIAWPELYSYFASNPSVETIHNLEDWDFLDSLPETQRLYERVRDENEVKNNISSFFDILYYLLDRDGNDEIDVKEFKHLMFAMYYTKMTEIKPDTEPPFYEFKKTVHSNGKKSTGFSNENIESLSCFCNDIFYQSYWMQKKRITIKPSTNKKYISLIYDRKRIGTLVTLANQPLKFRLGADDEILIKDLLKMNPVKVQNKDNEGVKLDKDLYKRFLETIIKDFDGKQTGWGETEIDIIKFNEIYPIQNNVRPLRRLLNQIYRILIDKELQRK